MNQKLSLADLPINGKKVLMRVDFNVPLDKEGKITDDTRIKASLPSIKYVLEKGGALILMSHLGRPKGKVDAAFSLKPCAEKLSQLLNQPVLIAPDCMGPQVEQLAKDLKPGQILLLENLRFHSAEEKPKEDPNFAKQLAALADFYVNDAFGTAHRSHASTVQVASYFQGKAAAGFLMQEELKFLGKTLINPEHPFVALIGGAKISTKLGVLKALLGNANSLLIGGGMAYTLLKAQGIAIGNSIHEDDLLAEARLILEESKTECTELLLPVDLVVADKVDLNAKTMVVDVAKGIPDGFEGVDIGPKTILLFEEVLKKAKTIFWNGPVGVFECPPFDKGTNAIAHCLAKTSATTIVGGGDSIAAVQAAGVGSKISHLSTGGGATLEYIEFGKLPGIEALSDSFNH